MVLIVLISATVIIDENIGIIDEKIDRKYRRKYCFAYFRIYIICTIGWNLLICTYERSVCGKRGLLQVKENAPRNGKGRNEYFGFFFFQNVAEGLGHSYNFFSGNAN